MKPEQLRGATVDNGGVECTRKNYPAEHSGHGDAVTNERAQILISVIILNYNGEPWLPKCIESVMAQTIGDRVEIVYVDNCSTDNSVATVRKLVGDRPRVRIVENAANVGFCKGNNIGAEAAQGEYLFFLNHDTWLETDCLEQLVAEVTKMNAVAATPWVLQYSDNTHQDLGFFGFDVLGLPSPSRPARKTREVFIAGGCSYLIKASVFHELGRFDPNFWMYFDEVDVSWRVWIAGHKIIGVPAARLHHRGAITVNPAGGVQTIEYRTSDHKRFLSNRNCLLTLLKNGQHLIALLTIPLVGFLFLESLFCSLMLRRWSFIKTTFYAALKDCWRLRDYIRSERQGIAKVRKHNDWWMLRFLRLPLNRWFEIKRLLQFGMFRTATS